MHGEKKIGASFLHILLAGSCVFFLIMSGLSFGFYLLGNYQSFMSRSQFFLLGIVKATGFFSMMSGAYYAVYLAASVLAKKEKKSPGFFLAAFSFAAGGGALAAAHFINTVTMGVR